MGVIVVSPKVHFISEECTNSLIVAAMINKLKAGRDGWQISSGIYV